MANGSLAYSQQRLRCEIKRKQLDTLVAKVEASDRDIKTNAHITYSFSRISERVLRSFQLHRNGELILAGRIDMKKYSNDKLNLKAIDGGGSPYYKFLVNIEDENDNSPQVIVSSLTNLLPEDSRMVTIFSITDGDTGDNGLTSCNIDANLLFQLKPTKNKYYHLVTQQLLDREQMLKYNIAATDEAKTTFQACSLDQSKLTYWLLPGKMRDVPVSSYISINSETGNLYAIRSVDYEDIKDFQVMVRAVDKGLPPLSSETTVRVLIRDENDNAPFVLCPLQNSTSPSKELVPRGAETGYLVTKVVAADRDSGQNSWLSYQLLKATDPSLFAIGTQNGEVKTTRPVNIRDSFKHTLIVAVRDNGHPPQSASATLRILLVDGFSDLYMKIMENPKGEVPQEGDHTLTMYLIICLVAISSIFLLSVMVFIAI
ncbi:LOW QUALITY PROTEIN: protocadherin beta-9-like [Vipera latastei]